MVQSGVAGDPDRVIDDPCEKNRGGIAVLKADLTGRVALVAGSTDKLGKVIALKFAECGADVCINGRDAAKGAALVKQIEGMGRRAIFEKANIRNYPECQRMAENTVRKLGKIDILVANGAAVPEGAQATLPKFFRETPPEDFMEIATTRWFSRAFLMKTCLEPMIERHYGKMILITTDGGRWPTPGESINGGAAAGLMLMTRTAAKEFTRWGIRLNTLSISLTGGPEDFQRIFNSPVGSVFRKAAERMPFGITPRENVAAAALFFAAPESDSITGAILSVNSGLCFP